MKASVEAAANIQKVDYPPRGQETVTAMARVTAAEVKTTRGQIIETAETHQGREIFLDPSAWGIETLRVGSQVVTMVTSQDTAEDVPHIHQALVLWVLEVIGEVILLVMEVAEVGDIMDHLHGDHLRTRSLDIPAATLLRENLFGKSCTKINIIPLKNTTKVMRREGISTHSDY